MLFPQQIFGIEGILWAGPIGDAIAMLFAAIFIVPVLRGLGEGTPIAKEVLLER